MVYVPAEDGSFISQKVARIAELIQEYDPNLSVKWIPPNRRNPGDPAFAIVERNALGLEQIAYYVQDESFMDERLLARIYMGDNARNDVQAELEAHNRAVRRYQEVVKQEERDAQRDLALSMIRSPLHTYRHNGKKISL